MLSAANARSTGNLLLETWSKNQVSINGDQITLPNLKAWGSVDKPLLPPDGGLSINDQSWRVKTGDAGVDKFKDSPIFNAVPGKTRPPPTDSAASALELALLSVVALCVAALL